MLDRKLIFDQNDPSTTGVGFILCVLDGVTLPAYTVYDYFGWLLSIAACPKPGATSENYNLPLLSCFANWCLKIAEHTNRPKGTMYAPMVVSIAVYKKQSRPWRPNEVNEEERAFLGVSIPDEKNLPRPSNRARVISFGRQALMEQSGLIPKHADQRRLYPVTDSKQNNSKGTDSKETKIRKTKSENPKSENPKSEKPKSEKPNSEKPKSEKPKSEKPKSEKPT
jgi:hypothetical protein